MGKPTIYVLAKAFVALCLLTIAACGGGGGSGSSSSSSSSSGGSGNSISLNTNALSFEIQDNGFASTKQVVATFSGAGVVVGTLPGQTMPDWLAIQQATQPSGGQVTFVVEAHAPGRTGSFTATLRFVTGNADGSGTRSVDLVVSLRVRAAFNLSWLSADFAEIDGGATPSQQIDVRGDDIAWRVTDVPAWLSVAPTSGTLPVSLTVHPIRGTLGQGRIFGFFNVIDDRSGRTLTVTASYEVRPAQIIVGNNGVDFSVTPTSVASQLRQQLYLSDDLDGLVPGKGVSWQIVNEGTNWLSFTQTTGTTAPRPTVFMEFNLQEAENLAPGGANGGARIDSVNSGGVARQHLVVANYMLRLPYSRATQPVHVAPNTPTSFLLFGEDLQDTDISRLRVGAQTPTAVTRRSSQLFEVQVGALAPGSYPITFENALGLRRSRAELQVAAAPSPPTGWFDSSGVKSRLIYQESRRELHAMNEAAQRIDRFRWDGNAWSTLAPVTVAGIASMDAYPDGKTLAVGANGGNYLLDMSLASPAPVLLRASFACAPYLVVLENGLIYSRERSPAPCYDGYLLGSIIDPIHSWNAPVVNASFLSVVTTSGNRRLMFGGVNGLSNSNEIFTFDVRTGAQTRRPHDWLFATLHLSSNFDGTRLLVNNTIVANELGIRVGNLPQNRFAILNPAGTRAYAYVRADMGVGRIDTFDLTVPTLPDTEFVAIGAGIALPAAPGDTQAHVGTMRDPLISMTLSDDGKTLFLSGEQNVLVFNLN